MAAVPALFMTERDQRNPVSVLGNVTAARNSLDTCALPMLPWAMTTSCLSIGRRAARTTLATLGRLRDIVGGNGKDMIFVAQEVNQGKRHGEGGKYNFSAFKATVNKDFREIHIKVMFTGDFRRLKSNAWKFRMKKSGKNLCVFRRLTCTHNKSDGRFFGELPGKWIYGQTCRAEPRWWLVLPTTSAPGANVSIVLLRVRARPLAEICREYAESCR